MAGRTYYAWEQDGKFVLSFFQRPDQAAVASGALPPPALSFDSRDQLEAELNQRNAQVKWY